MRTANSYLVVIDPQNIFASADSDWGSPFFEEAWGRIARLAPLFAGRIIVTRWLPTANRNGSWGEYFAAWPFADKPADHPQFALTATAQELVKKYGAQVLDAPTFSKWESALAPFLKTQSALDTVSAAETSNISARATSSVADNCPTPHLILTGVSTDCCVISTALAAADAGCYVTIPTDAVAHSNAANGAAALHVLELYEPMVSLTTVAKIEGEK